MAKEQPKLSFLDRLIQQTVADERTLGRGDDPARDQLPKLWDWLTRTEAGRDHVKDPALLTIRVGPDGILATLNDRGLGYALDFNVPHLADVVKEVERQLREETFTVRVLGKGEPKVRKRKPKS